MANNITMERWQIVENFVKHSVDDWKDKKPFFRHHTEKLVRHVARFLGGHTYDEDSGFDPLAHAICRALFLLWGNKQQRKS